MSEFLKTGEDLASVSAAATTAAFGSEGEGEREPRVTSTGSRVAGGGRSSSSATSSYPPTLSGRTLQRGGSMMGAKTQFYQLIQSLSDSDILESLFVIYACVQCVLIPLVNLQTVAPARCYPSLLAGLKDYYCGVSLDPFVCRPKLWMQGIGLSEVFFQFPLLIFLLDQYRKEAQAVSLTGKSVVFYLARLVCSVQAASLMVPILAEIGWNPVISQKWMLAGIYLPFFFVPFLAAVTSFTNLSQRFGLFSRQSLVHHQMLSRKRD